MRWGATVSIGMHAAWVAGLVLLPRPPRVARPAPLLPLDIRLTGPPAAGPGPAPVAVPGPTAVPAPAPVPAPVARGVVDLRPSVRSPLDPPPERTTRPEELRGVDPDGTVHFEDRSGPSAEMVTPDRMKRVVARELDEWARDPYAYQGRLTQSDGAGKWLFKPLNPLINPNRVADPDAKGTMFYVPLITGTFDVTDEVARRRGHETDAHTKLRLVDDTRERRADMAIAERARLATEAMYRLSDRLANIWDDERQTARERRALLFRLWDECEESDAGRTARASIIGFIRRRLPAGASDAYSVDELAELNRRRASRETFAPY